MADSAEGLIDDLLRPRDGDGDNGDTAEAEKETPAMQQEGRPRNESSSPAPAPAPSHVSHYPVCGLDLPFQRYDHRRLTARDIMVHRIMSDYMNPSRVVARTYETPITHPSAFDPIKAQDRELGMDLQVLRKMLFTSHSHDPPPAPGLPARNPPKPQRSRNNNALQMYPPKRRGRHVKHNMQKLRAAAHKEGEQQQQQRPVPTLGDEVLDLVMRHYIETDDMAMRTWISRARMPRLPSGPRTQSGGKNTGSVTRAQAVRGFSKLVETGALRDGKKWGPADVAHLRTLQGQVATQDRLRLYDGGATAVRLRREMEFDCHGAAGASRRLDYSHWTVTRRYKVLQTLPTWPERDPAIRFIPQLSWRDRKTFQPLWVSALLDLGLCPGRGRNRDGVWTTGQHPLKLRTKADPDGRLTGRFARTRKRSNSEPPPGSFAIADFPTPDKAVGFVGLEMVFPRMTLAQLDRRSRRRSLSRTRVEEMFDWDVNLASSGGGGSSSYSSTANRKKVGGNSNSNSSAGRDQDASGTSASKKSSKNSNPTAAATAPAAPAAPAAETSRPRKLKRYERYREEHYLRYRCENCFETAHSTDFCAAPCGHCGAPNPNTAALVTLTSRYRSHSRGAAANAWDSDSELDADDHARSDWDYPPVGRHGFPHLAPNCPVARHNRCKCGPFPVFHTAAHCPERCRRACGGSDQDKGAAAAAAAPGSFKHRNAMTCRARCCMCGLRGHSGRECRLRRCRCGAAHLGQDCCWHPECRVPGCDRFLCGVHCRECGSAEKPFVERRCKRCLGKGLGGDNGDGDTSIKMEDGEAGPELRCESASSGDDRKDEACVA